MSRCPTERHAHNQGKQVVLLCKLRYKLAAPREKGICDSRQSRCWRPRLACRSWRSIAVAPRPPFLDDGDAHSPSPWRSQKQGAGPGASRARRIGRTERYLAETCMWSDEVMPHKPRRRTFSGVAKPKSPAGGWGILTAFEDEHAHIHQHERQVVERHQHQVQWPVWRSR